VSATTGWSPGELDAFTATQLVRYAVGCLEHEARRLLREMQLVTLPLESYAGGHEIRDHLRDTACRMLDVPLEESPSAALTDEERANIELGIADIERELAAEHPWYAHDARRARERAAQASRGGRLRAQWVGDKRLLGDVRRFLGGRGQ
jgi:hypothetical protein